MLGLVIFDCDGVLIDSEPLCNRVVAAELTREGWQLTTAECQRLFVGLTFADTQAAAEAHLARPLVRTGPAASFSASPPPWPWKRN